MNLPFVLAGILLTIILIGLLCHHAYTTAELRARQQEIDHLCERWRKLFDRPSE